MYHRSVRRQPLPVHRAITVTLLVLLGWGGIAMLERVAPPLVVADGVLPEPSSFVAWDDHDGPFAHWSPGPIAQGLRDDTMAPVPFAPPPEDAAWQIAVEAEPGVAPNRALVVERGDTLMALLLRMGVDGGLNAGSNVAPTIYTELYETAGTDRGSAIQDAIEPLFDVCLEYGFAPASKTALVDREVLEADAVRPPLGEVPETAHERISDAVETLTDCST